MATPHVFMTYLSPILTDQTRLKAYSSESKSLGGKRNRKGQGCQKPIKKVPLASGICYRMDYWNCLDAYRCAYSRCLVYLNS